MMLVAVIDATVKLPELEDLTLYRSAASIPFAGRYRLIDFALSNVVNSSINSVGVFPSYPFVSLMDHIGRGKSWDLDRRRDGLFFLPVSSKDIAQMSVGAFAALAEHMNFFERSRQEYVVITNCFTVCQLDFEDMLESHIQSGADITEAVSGETSLKSYILKKELLIHMLHTYRDKQIFSIEDCVKRKKNSYVFGTYEYTGYFAIIDSIQSYFNESMALLDKDKREQLFLTDRPIYTKVKDEPPTRYMAGSSVKRALVANGCTIEGTVRESIISRAVNIKKGVKLDHCIIMQKCTIEEGCDLAYVIADKGVHIGEGVVLRGTAENPIVLRKGERVSKEDYK